MFLRIGYYLFGDGDGDGYLVWYALIVVLALLAWYFFGGTAAAAVAVFYIVVDLIREDYKINPWRYWSQLAE